MTRQKSAWSSITLLGWDKPRRSIGVLVDRCVPPTVARAINTLDDFHAVHLDAMYHPHGPHITDVQFLGDAGHNGWLVLTANPRIWHVPGERATILDNQTRVFCYGSAQLLIDAQGLVLGRWLTSVRRRSRRPDPCFWRLYPMKMLKNLP